MSSQNVDSSILAVVDRQIRTNTGASFAYIENDSVSNVTLWQFDQLARSFASVFHKSGGKKGDRVLILHPSGIEFIVAFFGCLRAGAIAVPLYPPSLKRQDRRFSSVLEDSSPSFFTSSEKVRANLQGSKNLSVLALRHLTWLQTPSSVSENDEFPFEQRTGAVDELAFLQYTSGSTNDPKGVMVSHDNIMHNVSLLSNAGRLTDQDICMSWLPLFHDMGLVGSLLLSIFVGMPFYFMSPASFFQRPSRWPKAIAQYGATVSGGPNFAFDTCVDHILPTEVEALNLSHWRVAFSGAEPIRASTLDRFVETFKHAGFQKTAYLPCYGMAESTLMIGGGTRDWTVSLSRPSDKLGCDVADSSPVIACGGESTSETIVIVDPEKLIEQAHGVEGEIWVSSPSVALGYWNNEAATDNVFRCGVEGRPEKFLRTGDLGFLRDGKLFVTGRLKDLVIINGTNHYPQDIELTVEQVDGRIRRNCIAAFSERIAGSDRLVVVAELDRAVRTAQERRAVVDCVAEAILVEYRISVHEVVLVRQSSLPKTSSGKVQRARCRHAYNTGGLNVLEIADSPNEILQATSTPSEPNSLLKHNVEAWLINYLVQTQGLAAEAIVVNRSFAAYGLDSISGMQLAEALGNQFGLVLDVMDIYDHPTPVALAAHVTALHGQSCSQTEAAVVQTLPIRKREDDAENAVAIVGISGKFPGAQSADEFWELLCAGKESVGDVPETRCDKTSTVPGVKGGYLEELDQFDAQFFGISGREASAMDPQQRLLLETSYEAMADACVSSQSLAGERVGVFVGLSSSEYASLKLRSGGELDAYWSTGNAISIAANRLSYFYDFKGPSVTIDTACSSSLVAIHSACQSIRSGESIAALACGVNLTLDATITRTFSQAGGLSSDGRCKAYDENANGMVRGEGVSVLLLMSVAEAHRRSLPIYALITGSAVNQDGSTNGITAPSGASQSAVIRDAFAAASTAFDRCSYVEGHGTGTPLGDPIELRALANVFRRNGKPPLTVGSLKSNIGHLEAAAGIASVVKVAFALRSEMLPPSINFERSSEQVDLPSLGLRIPTKLESWTDLDGLPRVAGVSGFGFGGTNAHIVLQAAPRLPRQNIDLPLGDSMVVLSSDRPQKLRLLASSFRHCIENADETNLHNLAHAMCVSRDHWSERLAIVFSDRQQLLDRLTAFDKGESRAGLSTSTVGEQGPNPNVFVFSGYRTTWDVDVAELLAAEPVFYDAIAEISALVDPKQGLTLLERLQSGEAFSTAQNIGRYQLLQFAYQIAHARLLQSWLGPPDAIVGHSFGEVAAAVFCGALDVANGVRVITARGNCVASSLASAGESSSMMSVELSRSDVEVILSERYPDICVAVCNSSTSVVLAGSCNALDALAEELASRDIFTRSLEAPGAGHSHFLDPVLPKFEKELGKIQVFTPHIPMMSTVTTDYISGEKLDAFYWCRNLRECVSFGASISRLIGDGFRSFVEIGPYPPILSPSISQNLREHCVEGSALPRLRRSASERTHQLGTLAELYANGATVDWTQVFVNSLSAPQDLPPIPWLRTRHWFEPEHRSGIGFTNTSSSEHPYLQRYLSSPVGRGVHIWEGEIGIEKFPYLIGHQVQGAVVFPTSGYLELAAAACANLVESVGCELTDVRIDRAMFFIGTQERTVQTVLSMGEDGRIAFQLLSRNSTDTDEMQSWVSHVTGFVQAITHDFKTDIVTHELDSSSALTTEQHYEAMLRSGVNYQGDFKLLGSLERNGAHAKGIVEHESDLETDRYLAYPPVLDSCLQTLAATVFDAEINIADGDMFLPIAINRFTLLQRLSSTQRLSCHAVLDTALDVDSRSASGNVSVLNASEQPLVQVEGFKIGYVGQHLNGNARVPSLEEWLFETRWQMLDKPVSPNASNSSNPLITILLVREDQKINELVSQLEINSRIIHVKAGQEFHCINADYYAIRTTETESYERLFDALNVDADSTLRIVSLLACDVDTSESLSATDIMRTQFELTLAAVSLIQVCTTTNLATNPQLTFVTTRCQPVLVDAFDIDLAGAALCGLCRVAQFEHPELSTRLLDLQNLQASVEEGSLSSLIENGDIDNFIAVRDGQRYRPHLTNYKPVTKTPLLETQFRQETSAKVVVRTDQTYLIVGGLSGIGLSIAEWLVAKGATHLLLAGRRIPELLAEDEQARLNKIKEISANVVTITGDVTDRDSVDQMILAAQCSDAPLVGVFHLAAAVDPALLHGLSPTQLETVLAPKVLGAWNLHVATRDLELEHFVMFSSVASLLGTPGQSNYAAANAFLDGLTHFRRQQNLPAITINWGGWEQVGLVARANATNQVEQRGFHAMKTNDALAMLDKILNDEPAQVGVMSVDWTVVKRQFPALGNDPFYAEYMDGIVDIAAAELSPQYLITLDETMRVSELTTYLQKRVAEALGVAVEEVPIDRELTKIGLDSLIALEMKSRIESETGATVPIVRFLEGPTIESLAQLLTEAITELGSKSYVNNEPDAVPSFEKSIPQLISDIGELSEAEIDAMLAEVGESNNSEKNLNG